MDVTPAATTFSLLAIDATSEDTEGTKDEDDDEECVVVEFKEVFEEVALSL